jgi:dipeptidyl aminopeptidase/acylaminoacyl peptidase
VTARHAGGRVGYARAGVRGFHRAPAVGLGLTLLLASCNAPAPVEERPAGREAPAPVAPGETPPPLASDDTRPAVEATYKRPSADVVAIVEAPPTPLVDVSPTGDRTVEIEHPSLPSIADVSRPYEALAGVRIDKARGVLRRTDLYTGISVRTIADGRATALKLPEGSALGWPVWSPDGTRVAVPRYVEDGIELWIADAATGVATRVEGVRVNDVLGGAFEWTPGSQALLVKTVPQGRGEAPPKPDVLPGPVVEDTSGQKATNRTYQDLLASARDEAAFEHFARAQLVRVGVDGQVTRLGEPDLWADVTTSPDGRYVLAERIHRPFSYSVPWYRFPVTIEVLDARAKVVRVVADQPLAEDIPIEGVRKGARDVHWQPVAPATLVWSEALDDGDPEKPASHRDRVMTHAAPFADTPEERLRVQHRLRSLDWTQHDGQVLVTEYDRDRRWVTTHLHELSQAGSAPMLLFDRSARDAYGDPGDPVHRTGPDGFATVVVHQGRIFLAGDGATPEGDRPFLDAFDLATKKSERLFVSEGEGHAEFIDFVGGSHDEMLVRREAPNVPPNYWIVSAERERQLTDFPDPHPQLTGIEKRILKYRRRDGVELSGTLYLPPRYSAGQRLPLVVWAYPLEFNDADTAGQVRAAPRTFTRLKPLSPLMFLTQGYAVLADASMPIVGDPETMNDDFLEQVVDSARAAIDAAVNEGVADRERVGVGGHSYGAFMTANLLAHTDLFRAGIARSGAYNRTLTPFGFQSERRTLWEAPETYVKVSPLFSADKIDEPILLVHGDADNNAGTFPLQTQRLFHALKGLGGTARLVLLPGESHGYAARESVLHVLAEQFEWFDRYVKNSPARPG